MLRPAQDYSSSPTRSPGRANHATIVAPAPYLAIYLPGATHPYMIYNSSGHYWWHTPQNIAPASQATRAAELITWGLRAHTYGTTTPRTGQGGDQQC